MAARAGLNRRYVEFLEKYPAVPPGRILRQLAAGLQTTPAALLGGTTDIPPAPWTGPVSGALQRHRSYGQARWFGGPEDRYSMVFRP